MGAALTSKRLVWAIGALAIAEAAIMPWTAHAFDAMSFLSHADRVYFAHVDPARLWPFGASALAAVLLSQAFVLVFPGLWNAMPLRLVLLKLPQWFADFGTAAIVRALAADRAQATAWAARYLFDPIVFFVTVVHGQNDALPNVWAVGGIALALLDRYELAGIALGLGAGTKFYPAAFLPLLLVVTLRRAGARRALFAAAGFVAASACLMLPIVWGRVSNVAAAYANNSFGPAGSSVSSASLWSLLSPHALRPQAEQFAAVAIALLLAALELRHRSERCDVARAAMLIAICVVVLNPGVHPPFYLWVCGPLVLYAAVTSDALVSLLGVGLSLVAIGMQFCQEGSDEYFLLVFGPGPIPAPLRCPAHAGTLAVVAAALCLGIVLASYRRTLLGGVVRALRRIVPLEAVVCTGLLAAVVSGCIVWAAATRGESDVGYRQERSEVNTFPIDPQVTGGGDRCALRYAPGDQLVYAGNPYAARFATAALAYTLFSPESMTIRGRRIEVASLPLRYVNEDLRGIDRGPIRILREFDVSSLLRPYRYVERFVERPCTLIANNPLLVYRFDLDGAQADAADTPFLARLRPFLRAEDK